MRMPTRAQDSSSEGKRNGNDGGAEKRGVEDWEIDVSATFSQLLTKCDGALSALNTQGQAE